MKQFINLLAIFIFCLSTTILTQNYPEGMVGYWKGEGNADDAYDDNDGTLINGATASATGQVGQAFSLDGIDDYVEVPDASSLTPPDFTYSAWIYPAAISRGAIFSKHGRTVAEREFYIELDENNKLGGAFYLAGYTNLRSVTSSVPVNQWSYITVTYSEPTMTFYINGAPVHAATTGGGYFVDGSYPLRIGNLISTFGSNAIHFNGKIDEPAIFNQALTAEEIQQHYVNGLNGLGFEENISVTIDINPGSDPNSINHNINGVIPVAILTTSTVQGEPIDFDATTVDPSTVKFGSNEASIAHRKGHIEDVDGDGDLDLLLHFRTQETGIRCGDTAAGLSGETYGGQLITGTDAIQTVGCGNMNKGYLAPDAEISSQLPESFALNQNFPNPFNPTTKIRFQIPELSFVILKVYDVLGKEISTLVNVEKPIGNFEVEFDAIRLPSGIYFYRLQADSFVETKKMVLIK